MKKKEKWARRIHFFCYTVYYYDTYIHVLLGTDTDVMRYVRARMIRSHHTTTHKHTSSAVAEAKMHKIHSINFHFVIKRCSKYFSIFNYGRTWIESPIKNAIDTKIVSTKNTVAESRCTCVCSSPDGRRYGLNWKCRQQRREYQRRDVLIQLLRTISFYFTFKL